MAIITYKDLSKLRKQYADKKIVFCSGTFDLPHAGHVLFFEECKRLGDVLVVAVGNDIMTRKNKGDQRPILNQHLRLKIIDSLKPVDYSMVETIITKNLLAHLEPTFKKLKPNLYVVNHDAFDMPQRKMISKKHNVKLAVLDRVCPPEFENISTTKIIEKIKNL